MGAGSGAAAGAASATAPRASATRADTRTHGAGTHVAVTAKYLAVETHGSHEAFVLAGNAHACCPVQAAARLEKLRKPAHVTAVMAPHWPAKDEPTMAVTLPMTDPRAHVRVAYVE